MGAANKCPKTGECESSVDLGTYLGFLESPSAKASNPRSSRQKHHSAPLCERLYVVYDSVSANEIRKGR